jgi:hypothetical protein
MILRRMVDLLVPPPADPAHQREQSDPEIVRDLAARVRPLVSTKRTASVSNCLVKRLCFDMEFLTLHEKLSTFPGQVQKAEQGIWPTKTPLGYRNITGPDGEKIIATDPALAPIVARLFEW